MDAKIAYQNKDITSKVLAENFKGKSLRVYGINVPKIVQVLPTNLPQIEANELKIDNLFLLEDDDIMTFVLTGLLVFADKVIDEELSNQVKEWIRMTQVERLYELEKEQALAEKDAEIAKVEAKVN